MADAAVTPLLNVREVSKTFGHRVAVNGVSFTVEAGGSLAIVGESGSGKSTVARMIVGLTSPTSGSIEFEGQDRSRPPTNKQEWLRRARQVQIVFQDPTSSLDRRQTALSCLEEVLALRGLAKEARMSRARELADLVGLNERQLRAWPRELSGGQRQRIGIARALAAEPRAIILDESVAALDVSIQAQILNLLTDIRNETGVSYLVISHDLAVVRHLTEDVVVMRHGQIVESGATGSVLDNPQHPYTRRLRDSIPRPGWRPVRMANSGSPVL